MQIFWGIIAIKTVNFRSSIWQCSENRLKIFCNLISKAKWRIYFGSCSWKCCFSRKLGTFSTELRLKFFLAFYLCSLLWSALNLMVDTLRNEEFEKHLTFNYVHVCSLYESIKIEKSSFLLRFGSPQQIFWKIGGTGGTLLFQSSVTRARKVKKPCYGATFLCFESAQT